MLRNAAAMGACAALLVSACSKEPETIPKEGTNTTTSASEKASQPKLNHGKPDPSTAMNKVQSDDTNRLLPPVADIEPATGPQARAPLGTDPQKTQPFHEPGEITPVATKKLK